MCVRVHVCVHGRVHVLTLLPQPRRMPLVLLSWEAGRSSLVAGKLATKSQNCIGLDQHHRSCWAWGKEKKNQRERSG